MKLKWERHPHAWCTDGDAGEYQIEHHECWIHCYFKEMSSKGGWAPTVDIGKKLCQMIEDHYCEIKRRK